MSYVVSVNLFFLSFYSFMADKNKKYYKEDEELSYNSDCTNYCNCYKCTRCIDISSCNYCIDTVSAL